MKKVLLLLSITIVFTTILPGCKSKSKSVIRVEAEGDDAAAEHKDAMEFEFNMLKNPRTGTIPDNIRQLELEQTSALNSRNQHLFRVSANSYSFAGPENLAGRTRTVVFDVRYGISNNVVLAGGISGGVWKSLDGGATWQRKSPLNAHFGCTSIAQDTRVGFQNTWYYSTGEALGNSVGISGFYGGSGVFKSVDNGETWTRLTNSNNSTEAFNVVEDVMMKVIVSPVNGYVYAGFIGGIKRSVDGGATWANVLSEPGSNSIYQATELSITSTGRVYASFPGACASTVDGVWTSTSGDAGAWVRIAGTGITTDPPSWDAVGNYGRVITAVSPSNENIIYVMYSRNSFNNCASGLAEPEAKLFKYNQLDGSWVDLSANLPDEAGCLSGNDPFAVQGGYDMVVKIHPTNPNLILIGGTNAYRSTDGFTSKVNTTRVGGYASTDSYAQYQNSHPDIHDFTFIPGTANAVFCANDGGVQRTTDITASPVTWTFSSNGYRTYQYYYVAIDPRPGYTSLMGGAQDNGTTRNIGGSGINFESIISGDGVSVGLGKPIDGFQHEFCGSQFGTAYRRTSDVPAGFINAYITPNGTTSGLFVTLFHLDPDNTEKLYYVNDATIYRTSSASTITASTWGKMTGITGAVSGYISALTTTRGAYSPTSNLFFGNDKARIYRMTDPANLDLTTAPTNISGNIPASGWVSSISVNPRNDDTALVTLSNYGIVSVYWTGNAKSANPTWLNVEGALTIPSYLSSAIAVVGGEVQYFVGTSAGFYKATIDAANPSATNWVQEGPTSMGNAPIRDIKLRASDNTFLIGTHGYGMWTTSMRSPSAITDYFRTRQSGNWSDVNTWESSAVADFSSDVNSPATIAPNSSANVITVRDHNVTVTANVTIDQTILQPTASLSVSNGVTLSVINNGMLLQSTAAGTARIGNSQGGSIIGNVTVERFIPDDGHRAWRMLSVPTTGSQTIYQAWQDTAKNYGGYGTLITSNLYTAGNGFDMASPNPAILIHNQGGLAGPAWVGANNTNATALSSNPGYMLFIRGDRTATPSNATHPSTTLRSTGTLKQGTQSAVTVSSTGTGYTLVGNPYASPIDFETFATTTNLNQSFLIWDANLAGSFGVGGYRVVERTAANTYQQTPQVAGGTVANNTMRYIHSGQAFFLKATGGNASVVLTESSKATQTSTIVPFRIAAPEPQVLVNLMIDEGNDSLTLADGVRARYDNSFSSATTGEDIIKMNNFSSENLGLRRDDKIFIVEKRPEVVSSDTLYLNLANTKNRNYRFQIQGLNIPASLQGYLKDNFTGKQTAIDLNNLSLNGVTNVDFAVTTDPASAAADRFSIVFQTLYALPSSITSIKAYQQNNSIAVEWKVENESEMKQYEVEKSSDGHSFNRASTLAARGNNNNTVKYSWVDVNPATGNNFYRLKRISLNGDGKYSEIVRVTISKGKADYNVYPNPLTGNSMQLQLINQPAGVYVAKLFNDLGQVVLSTQIQHQQGSSTESLQFGNRLAKGNYILKITAPDNSKRSIKIFH